MSASALSIGRPRLDRSHDRWRIAADVEGKEVFYESSLPLVPAAETFVCPFLALAMRRQVNLRSPAALNPVLLENLGRIRKTFTEWWPHLTHGEIEPPPRWKRIFERPPRSAPRPDQSGLFYTGGVDSGYSLQKLHPHLKYGVFVEGFDIPLGDTARLQTARERLSATVNRCGAEFVTVRTNLREHPVFNEITWEITHIAALAGIAHAMCGNVSRMYVSATNIPAPWGSTPEVDPLWSSDKVKIEHFGAGSSRLERASSIAHWEPLRGGLHVCWENNTADLNCGFCEKCLRTRFQLRVSGAADELDSFPAGYPLRETLAKLPVVHHHLHGHWREIAALVDEPELRREIDRLLS